MDTNLGAPKQRIRTNRAAYIPLFYTVAGLLIIGLLVLPASTAGNNPVYSIAVVVAALLLAAYIIVSISYCHIMLHENAIVIQNIFNKQVIMRDDISVIHWDSPGVYAGQTRSVTRKTNGYGEVMIKGGKMVKLPDATYKSLPILMGAWQEEYKIPREF